MVRYIVEKAGGSLVRCKHGARTPRKNIRFQKLGAVIVPMEDAAGTDMGHGGG